MKKILLSFAAISAFSMVGMLFLNNGSVYSSSTGAPGPTTCSQSGCHNDGGAAQTHADVFLTVEDSSGNEVTEFVAGQQYTVTLGKSNTTSKVGFALSATAGALTKNGSDAAVQKIGTYLTHTFTGTTVSGGEAEWTAKWTAPASGTAKLTLFINETNNNGTNTGDMIYTKSVDLIRMTTGLNTLNSDIRFKAFPNPVSDMLYLTFEVKYPSEVSVKLTSIDGKQTELLNGVEAKGTVEKAFDVNGLAKGIYFLTIRSGEGSATQKILIH